MAAPPSYTRFPENRHFNAAARLSSSKTPSIYARRSVAMRPISAATSIDSTGEDDYHHRRRPVHGWSTRKENVLLEAAEDEEVAQGSSDAESIESLSSRARFMSEMLSDSDSSIDGRQSADGQRTSTTISSFDGPSTPKSPSPMYTDGGFPFVEIVGDEKSPMSRSVSFQASPTLSEKIREMTTIGPRGPHLFRSSSSSYSSDIAHINIPRPNMVMPPTPSASEGANSPVSPLSPVAMLERPQPTPPSESESPFTTQRKSQVSQVISEYDLEEVRSWTPAQVCAWMSALGFGWELVEKFQKNDITGAILVDLKWEDLKELDIQSFGKRIELWTEIHHLRARTLPTPDLPGAEFVRSSSRVSRGSSTPSLKPSLSFRYGSQAFREPKPEITAQTSLQQEVISEADEETSEPGNSRKHVRPQLRKKARKANVRIPRRQISVDSIIITSDDGEEEFKNYAKKLHTTPSIDDIQEEHFIIRPRRALSRRRVAEESNVVPNDSVSSRGGKKHKCKKHGHRHHHHSTEDNERSRRNQGKPHRCSKGDRCPKHGKRERSRSPEHGTILIATTPSIADASMIPRISGLESPSPRPQSFAAGSVLASSDVLGPVQGREVQLRESTLREIQRVDPLENVKQFLTHQHLQHLEERRESPPPVPTKSAEDLIRAQRGSPPPPPTSSPPPVPRDGMLEHRFNASQASFNSSRTQLIPLPPAVAPPTTLPSRTQTPSFGLRSQGMERAAPPHLNFSTPSRMKTPSLMRTDTPFSEADVPAPCTTPFDPRQFSQSVPPDLHYRRYPTPNLQNLVHALPPRSASARPAALQMASLDENAEWEAVEDEQASVKMAPSPHMRTHSGWMKKRRTNWFRHEWPDYHFVLRGTRLGYSKDVATDEVGAIDMDQYQVACSNSGSTKLSAAFKVFSNKKKEGSSGAGTYFFQLVPASGSAAGAAKAPKKLSKVHYFAVGSREERIDWMRELMLAKAIKQKKQGFEVEVNGERV